MTTVLVAASSGATPNPNNVAQLTLKMTTIKVGCLLQGRVHD
jgi:hypothetical protein